MSVPCCLCDHSFVVQLEIWHCDVPSFVFPFQQFLGNLGLFMVSGLTFRILNSFEFIFVSGKRECSGFILLYVAVELSQHHLLKRLSNFNRIFFSAFPKTEKSGMFFKFLCVFFNLFP